MTARTNKLLEKATTSSAGGGGGRTGGGTRGSGGGRAGGGGAGKKNASSSSQVPQVEPRPTVEEEHQETLNESSSEEEEEQVIVFFNRDARLLYESWEGTRSIMATKVILPNSIAVLGVEYLVSKLRKSYLHTLLTLDEPTHKDEILQFYANFEKDKQNPGFTKVNSKLVACDMFTINKILGAPWVDSSHLRPNPNAPYENYHTQSWPKVSNSQPLNPLDMGRKYWKWEGPGIGSAKRYSASKLSVEERIIWDWVCYNVLPNGGHTSEPTIIECMIFYYIMEGLAINPGFTIHSYMKKAAKGKKKEFPYGSLITRLLKDQKVPIFDREDSLPKPYDEDWFKNKGLVLDPASNKYKHKEGDGASSSKRRKCDEGEPSWFKKLNKVWSCFKGLHEQSQLELAELQAEQQAYIEGKGIQLTLSEDEDDLNLGEVPQSSDENGGNGNEELHGGEGSENQHGADED